jgi:thiol-disulfide isomerase/thioredoxin
MKKFSKMIPVTAMLLTMTLYMTGCGQNSDSQSQSSEETKTDEQTSTDDTAADNDSAAADSEETTFGTFASKDLDGNDITQEIFKDAKVTMINVWGTFCGPCISEMPDLGELAAEYKDKDLQIIGIPLDVTDGKNEETARDIVDTTKADYTHILPDSNNSILRSIQAVPTTIFVNQDGEILDIYTGAKSKSQWIAIMDDELSSGG